MIILILLLLFFACAVFWDKSNGIKMRDNLAHGKTGYKPVKLTRKQMKRMTPAQIKAHKHIQARRTLGL